MAHLWTQCGSGWDARRLEVAGLELAPPAMRNGPAKSTVMSGRIIQADACGARAWALVTARDADVRVNCREVLGGLCVLGDRDEIRIGGEVQYFSTETLAAAE